MTTDQVGQSTGRDVDHSPFHGDRADLRAMKRALARAPLGPTATLALTHAILHLEDELAQPSSQRD
jgi:hypothetical protein